MPPVRVKGCFATRGTLHIFANLHRCTRSSLAVGRKTFYSSLWVYSSLATFVASGVQCQNRQTALIDEQMSKQKYIFRAKTLPLRFVWFVDTLGRERLMTKIIRWSSFCVDTDEVLLIGSHTGHDGSILLQWICRSVQHRLSNLRASSVHC